VDRSDLDALLAGADPQAALVTIDADSSQHPAAVIAEPSLSNQILARMWRTNRDETAPLTQVETAILQQFLGDVCRVWSQVWRSNRIEARPALTMAATLTVVGPQLPLGEWYVARTVVLDADEEVGVLLFAYPGACMQMLVEARRSIGWRYRIERGLDGDERAELYDRVRSMGPVTMNIPVQLNTEIKLAALGELQRGDVIALDVAHAQPFDVKLLDRTVTATLGRRGTQLALAVNGTDSQIQPLAMEEAPPPPLGEMDYSDPNADYTGGDTISDPYADEMGFQLDNPPM
jgi:flagellar motor switch protein FliM